MMTAMCLQLEELQCALDQESELAASRLVELQELIARLATAKAENDRLRAAVLEPSMDAVVHSTHYICLQSQFSVLLQESNKLK